ncbi:hypothetical protein Q4554_15415 [Leptospira santarosai]|uniref:hypothetical protein n=1 Tax=Leptospira santarosai TaxID=28183 RepID=UPI0026E21022|nr:hypothetical protein [Leptospira santarosai]MDO6395466.1 hypothetical protein [Leptospira santarosai]
MSAVTLPIWVRPNVCICGTVAESRQRFGYRTRAWVYFVECDECERITAFYKTAIEAVKAWNSNTLDTED